MSYVVLKSTPKDNGWIHEPILWTDDEELAYSYAEIPKIVKMAIGETNARFNVIETDMSGWLEPCEDQGVYQCGIGEYFYIDEGKLNL